jgi:hypothetical protein
LMFAQDKYNLSAVERYTPNSNNWLQPMSEPTSSSPKASRDHPTEELKANPEYKKT